MLNNTVMSMVCLTQLIDTQLLVFSQGISKKKEAPCHQHETDLWSHLEISVDLASSAAVARFLKNVDASLTIPSSSHSLVLVSFVPLLSSFHCEKPLDWMSHHH